MNEINNNHNNLQTGDDDDDDYVVNIKCENIIKE